MGLILSWFNRVNFFAIIWRAMLAADRSIKLWAVVLSMPFITSIIIWIIYMIQRHWDGKHEAEQLKYLFYLCLALIILLGICYTFLTTTKLDARGPGGFQVGISPDDTEKLSPGTSVTTTQIVEKKDDTTKSG
jgi:hypothetical protein